MWSQQLPKYPWMGWEVAGIQINRPQEVNKEKLNL